jgi:hypothetical protein
VILPAHGELCGCYAPTEPLYSTRGLERCTACNAVTRSPSSGGRLRRDESPVVVAPPEGAETADDESGGI